MEIGRELCGDMGRDRERSEVDIGGGSGVDIGEVSGIDIGEEVGWR